MITDFLVMCSRLEKYALPEWTANIEHKYYK